MEVKRKEGENPSALLYRFSKKIQQSGVLREAKKRRFRHRAVNRRKRRASALYREERVKEIKKAKKLGVRV